MNTKSIIRALFAGLMMLSGAAAWSDSGADEQAVIAAENQGTKALQTNNIELFASLLADKIVNTDQDGTVLVGKAANVADARATTWTSMEVKDMKVTVYGDAAIATYTWASKGTYKGKPFDDRGRSTDTWVKMNGKWLEVAGHQSLIKK
jgi:ketosteroid isomerase-like protein